MHVLDVFTQARPKPSLALATRLVQFLMHPRRSLGPFSETNLLDLIKVYNILGCVNYSLVESGKHQRCSVRGGSGDTDNLACVQK